MAGMTVAETFRRLNEQLRRARIPDDYDTATRRWIVVGITREIPKVGALKKFLYWLIHLL